MTEPDDIQLRFTNRFAHLPADFYTKLPAEPLSKELKLVSFNAEAAKLIGMEPGLVNHPHFLEYFTGKRALPGAEPLASVYAGHQFGSYVPQLGDGRALLLGGVTNEQGEEWEIQLKGSGKTPYSRFGDGRAVLRSSIREYLCSEAMHGLGIPTTRALCIVASDDPVYRESIETAAIITRLSPSFIRFGHFEYWFYQQNEEKLRELADFVIDSFYPEQKPRDERYEKLFYEAVLRTAKLVAQWQAYGFAHGVLNSDNMSILGLTIDYGPFGFLDAFESHYIPNHSDETGRYAFDAQPTIGLWNLKRLAIALSGIIPVESLESILHAYEPTLMRHYYELMQQRFGLATWRGEEDMLLMRDILMEMQEQQVDYTLFFRDLCDFTVKGKNDALRKWFKQDKPWEEWAKRYATRLKEEGSGEWQPRSARMKMVNPQYILRNYLLQQAIEKAQAGDFSEVDKLLSVMRTPFDTQQGAEAYAQPAPKWAKELCISCSS